MLGHSHALSGAVTGIAAGILLHLPVPQVATLAGFTAGMALLPDLDKCGSSPARCHALRPRRRGIHRPGLGQLPVPP